MGKIMDGMINHSGELLIARKGFLCQAECPLKFQYCNHNCALFQEPDYDESEFGNVFLGLCNGVQHTFEKFDDNRKGASE